MSLGITSTMDLDPILDITLVILTQPFCTSWIVRDGPEEKRNAGKSDDSLLN